MLGHGEGQWEIETYAKACLDPLTSIFVSVIPKMLGYYKVDYKTRIARSFYLMIILL